MGHALASNAGASFLTFHECAVLPRIRHFVARSFRSEL
jgi:hypothetical protein